MGFFDWILGRDAEPAAGPVQTGSEATVHAGGRDLGLYSVPETVIAQGSRSVMDFLLGDDDLEEVMYNGSDQPMRVAHRAFGMCEVNHALDEETANLFVSEIATRAGTIIDANRPLFDGTLPDGSRVNIAVPPVTNRYPSITIRKFKNKAITIADMVAGGTLSSEAAAFLWTVIDGMGGRPANLIVCGGTASGKTTFLNALTWFIPPKDRMVVIEDTQELMVQLPNVVKMVTSETADMDRLLVNALRMRPDRIIVGEVRGPEARTLFGAMNTGHDGCIGTLHANSARESLQRATTAPMSVPLSQISGLDLVVVMEQRQTADGPKRQVVEIAEVSGISQDTPRLNQLFVRDYYKGVLSYTGVPSRLRSEQCRSAGVRTEEFERIVQGRARAIDRLVQRGASQEEFEELVASQMS